MQEMQESWIQSLGWEDPLEKEMTNHSRTLPGKFRGQRILVGYSPWDHKESDATEQLTMHKQCFRIVEHICPGHTTSRWLIWILKQSPTPEPMLWSTLLLPLCFVSVSCRKHKACSFWTTATFFLPVLSVFILTNFLVKLDSKISSQANYLFSHARFYFT